MFRRLADCVTFSELANCEDSNQFKDAILESLEKLVAENKQDDPAEYPGCFVTIITEETPSLSSYVKNSLFYLSPNDNRLVHMLQLIDRYIRLGYSFNQFTAHRVVLASFLAAATQNPDTRKSSEYNRAIEQYNAKMIYQPFMKRAPLKTLQYLNDSLKALVYVINTPKGSVLFEPESVPKSNEPEQSVIPPLRNLDTEDSKDPAFILDSKEAVLGYIAQWKQAASSPPNPDCISSPLETKHQAHEVIWDSVIPPPDPDRPNFFGGNRTHTQRFFAPEPVIPPSDAEVTRSSKGKEPVGQLLQIDTRESITAMQDASNSDWDNYFTPKKSPCVIS